MPEVTLNNEDLADTSFTSIEGVDGDTSIDSMGGTVVSQWRDIFLKRSRREVDFVVTKHMMYTGEVVQVALLVVELKRDDLEFATARAQIEDYMVRILTRVNASIESAQSLRGMLVLGAVTLRLEASIVAGEASITYTDGYDEDRELTKVERDSYIVNSWLVEQAQFPYGLASVLWLTDPFPFLASS
ncbi:hypothetical protein CPB83DRAFT_894361 [Crepidotus variabilis]|uniref:Uncharacterized protein n=1 Tax=Crepidotus variabilis TaxID=179855 RepID=A0A9P6EGD0_9AGAR|nr:hypothetical protein CPB83DRAFT_894361 [Crepidotus variabilis]